MRMRLTIAALLAVASLAAQESRTKPTLIKNAVVHTLAGDAIEGGSVLIQDGKIVGVGKKLSAPRGATVIDAEGKHLYPGMFDAYSPVGLTEVSAVQATLDMVEEGRFNPHLQSLVAVHPDSEHIPVSRSTGVTHALTAMNGELIAGQAAVVNLDGWTYEEMAIEASGPLIVRWPVVQVFGEGGRRFRGGDAPRPKTFDEAEQLYQERIAELESWLEAAEHYAQATADGASPTVADRKLAALVPFIRGEKPMLVLADNERTIRNAVSFAEEHGLRMILVGGAEAWKVKELLAEKEIPVILGKLQEVPGHVDEAYDRVFTQPKELMDAGVKFAIGTGIPGSARQTPWPDSRNLPFEVAAALPFGLPREEAIKALTVYPAEILGLGDQLGTIEEGKIANLILVDGDPLEVTTQLDRMFINGRLIEVKDKHQQLYERYINRP